MIKSLQVMKDLFRTGGITGGMLPAVNVSLNNNFSFDNTEKTILWDTIEWDEYSKYDLLTGKWTAPFDCKIKINCNMLISYPTSGIRTVYGYIYKNTSKIASDYTSEDTITKSLRLHREISVVTNDTIYINVRGDDSGNSVIGGYISSFSIDIFSN